MLDGSGPDIAVDDYSGNLVGTLMRRTLADKRITVVKTRQNVDDMDTFMKVNVKVTQKV